MKLFIFILSLGLPLFPLLAETSCPEVTPVKWLLKEVEDVHPSLLFKRLRLDQIKAGEHEAKKFINPELEHFSVTGREFEPKTVYMNETRLWFTLQLAGKRQGKIAAWEKSLEVEKFEAELLKQAVLKDLWLNFFRLHQIHKELKVKSRVSSNLNSILEQFKKRKMLSPDQMMEERIIEMVKDNFELSGNVLEREKLSIFEFLKEVTGYQCRIRKISAQEDEITWPKPNEVRDVHNFEGILSRKAGLELSFFKASEALANKRAMPDLRIGPVIQNYQSGNMDVYTGGLAFVFPLPVFDRNTSERIQTKLQSHWAEKRLGLEQKKEEARLIFRIEKYESGLSVMKEVEVIEKSLKRFDSVQSWFKDGRISISNIVEFCRQLDEITKNFHQGESMLMSDLLEIYELKGKLSTENLLKLI